MQQVAVDKDYPKKDCEYEDTDLSGNVPFALLCGEYYAHMGRTEDGIVTLTNYRVVLKQDEICHSIPLGLIEATENRDIIHMHILCKDNKSYK